MFHHTYQTGSSLVIDHGLLNGPEKLVLIYPFDMVKVGSLSRSTASKIDTYYTDYTVSNKLSWDLKFLWMNLNVDPCRVGWLDVLQIAGYEKL